MERYRIIREENHLKDTVRYIIEREKTFLWSKNWTQDLALQDVVQSGPIGASTYDGALWKMNKIKINRGEMIRTSVVIKELKQ
tara:strand:+ start:226 stop:474 length:249 start_codon:yes stop_codon:yes gene_type:complete